MTMTLIDDANNAKNPLNKVNKYNQQLPATDTAKFSNLYCELRFPTFRKKNLNIEKKLALPDDLRQSMEARIQGLGLGFIDRNLRWINTSWVQEFYCNFFREALDSVHLRGEQILITEGDNGDVLHCLPRTGDTCAYQHAEIAINAMTIDYEALKSVIATPDAPWVMDANNKRPKGMLFAYLCREARTWIIELAGAPWRDDDAIPPPSDDDDKEVTTPWVHGCTRSPHPWTLYFSSSTFTITSTRADLPSGSVFIPIHGAQ
ncbi:hypothetical protein AHAS_Ahas01G0188900 [Arachis hypogaea]